MKKGILIAFLSFFLIGCGASHKPQIITVVPPTLIVATNTPISITLTTDQTLIQKLSTPQLINQAFANGEITEEYRLLYLAYALYEYESLPTQYRGNAGWRGTSVVIELYEGKTNPSVICSMSPYVKSEFQRVLNLDPKSCN